MSKELDYLNNILYYQPLTLVERTIIESIKEKLEILEAIKKVEPTEALKYVDTLKEDGCITTLYQGKALETIRQSLIQSKCALDEIQTIMDTWATSGLIADEMALEQIDKVIKKLVSND